MRRTSKPSIGPVQFEKESLLAVRSMDNGLVMHFMYFANEVRDFGQIPKTEGAKVPQREIDLSKDLIEKLLAEELEPEKHHDEYRERFLVKITKRLSVDAPC
jgi:non-homologous end joining protein Ku